MFSLNRLEIFDDCAPSLRKGLLQKEYIFTNQSLKRDFPDLWENKINIQAIVGKNGSGKSTILDLIYALINNFAYMYNRNDNQYSQDIVFIPELSASLHYSIENHNYELKCRNYFIELLSDGNCIFRAAIDSQEHFPSIEEIPCEQGDFLNNFFFSSVTNFSLQAYLPDNYYLKKAYIHKPTRHQPDKLVTANWFQQCFHKNDGYKTPIIINPNRSQGILFLGNLIKISKDQSTSLFIYAKKDSLPFFEPYEFCKLNVFDVIMPYQQRIVEDSSDVFKHVANNTIFLTSFRPEDINDFFVNILQKNLINTIIDFFDIRSAANSYYYRACVAYLVFKIWKISKKAPLYSSFNNSIEIAYNEYNVLDVIQGSGRSIIQLLEFIKNDTSYVTKKIRRTINFLKLAEGRFENYNATNFFNLFTKRSMFYNGEEITPSIIDSALPPPIFDYDLILAKLNQNKKNILVFQDKYLVEEKDNRLFYYDDNHGCHELENRDAAKILEINYKQLSSGEIQLIQTISAHLYHITNLISSLDSSSQYKCFNLIFDEVEICFHPEFQRQFIHRLITTLESFKTNKTHFINILFVTHSPFILSDIPKDNILYLKEGKTDLEKNTRTFGANINDLFKDSFFLNGGFIGEYANRKITSLAKYLKSKRKVLKPWNKENSKKFIENIIGDDIIKDCLNSMFYKKFGNENA